MYVAIRVSFGTGVAALLVVLAGLATTGCSHKEDSSKTPEPPAAAAPSAVAPAAAVDEPLPPLAYESALPEAVRAELN